MKYNHEVLDLLYFDKKKYILFLAKSYFAIRKSTG